MTLQAYCESCESSREVYVDELFEFDCRCPTCDSMLVIEEDEGTEAEAPARSERATKADTLSVDELPYESYESYESYDLERDDDPPTKADSEDPYALAALALGGGLGNGVGLEETQRASREERPASSERLRGLPAESPPLPSWDGGDTQQVADLASGGLTDHGPTAAPLAGGDDLSLDVEVVQLSSGGTGGTGSRTYERDEVLGAAGARGNGGDDGTARFVREQTPPPAEAIDAPARGHSLFGEDLDWLALIDDALPEEEDGDSEAARVYIRLPEDAAPKNDDDTAQFRRLQATVERLQQETPGALDALLQGEAPIDTRVAKRYTDERPTPDQEADTKTFAGKKRRTDDDPAPDGETRPFVYEKTHGLAEDADRARDFTNTPRGDAEPKEQDTRSWPPAAEPVDPASAPTPLSSRRPDAASSEARSGNGRNVVEQFRREDLDPGLICAREVASLEADYFRQLYQRIFHSKNGSSPRVILVTSPRRREGKTTVAGNLSIVAARMPGRGAVLVDADPRGGGVLRAFGQRTNREGLLEALQTRGDPTNYVLQFNLGTLDVIPLGIRGSDAAELIASDRMGDFVESLRQCYSDSVIILDGSAVLTSADPLVLAREVDGVVLVVRAGHTSRDEVRRVMELLGPDNVLGVVLNDTAVTV